MCPTILSLLSVLGHPFTTWMFAVTYMYFSIEVMIKAVFCCQLRLLGTGNSLRQRKLRLGEISSVETKFPLSKIISWQQLEKKNRFNDTTFRGTKECDRISIVLLFSFGRAKKTRIRYLWTHKIGKKSPLSKIPGYESTRPKKTNSDGGENVTKKVALRSFKLNHDYPNLVELNSWEKFPSSKGQWEICRRLFIFSIKREITP